MKKQSTQDERVVIQRRKIQSDGFGLVFFLLLASVMVQQFIFDAPFEQYAVELFCFLGMSCYMIIRNLAVGNNLFGESKRAKYTPLIYSIVAGIAATAINGVLNYSRYAEKYQETGIGLFFAVLGITFISATLLTFVVLSCFGFLNKRKQSKIQKWLDENDLDE